MAASSMESAISSRLTREAFMPSVPMLMPSLMEIVFTSIGVPAGGADAGRDVGREFAVAEVARHRADPGVRHHDQRLAQVLAGEAHGLELRARRGAAGAVDEGVAAMAGVEGHDWLRAERRGVRDAGIRLLGPLA